MTRRAFEKIRDGLLSAVEIIEGRADPSTYRVHVPDPETGRMVHVPGMRIGPAPLEPLSERAAAALSERRRRRRRVLSQTALFDELYTRRHGRRGAATPAADAEALHAAE